MGVGRHASRTLMLASFVAAGAILARPAFAQTSSAREGPSQPFAQQPAARLLSEQTLVKQMDEGAAKGNDRKVRLLTDELLGRHQLALGWECLTTYPAPQWKNKSRHPKISWKLSHTPKEKWGLLQRRLKAAMRLLGSTPCTMPGYEDKSWRRYVEASSREIVISDSSDFRKDRAVAFAYFDAHTTRLHSIHLRQEWVSSVAATLVHEATHLDAHRRLLGGAALAAKNDESAECVLPSCEKAESEAMAISVELQFSRDLARRFGLEGLLEAGDEKVRGAMRAMPQEQRQILRGLRENFQSGLDHMARYVHQCRHEKEARPTKAEETPVLNAAK